MLGAVIGASTEAAAALLLYTEQGFLLSAGFLIGLALAALGLGLWVGTERYGMRRRWVGMVFAYVAAGIVAFLWVREPALRDTGFGGALAALFLLAEPAYTAGATFAALARRQPTAVPAFFGAALGVLAAAVMLIPRLHASVIFLAAAAVLLLVALLDSRWAPESMNANGFSLNGKRALVTGVGDRGQVGFAVAHRLIEAGARVCVTSLSAAIEERARELGNDTVGIQADLTNEDDVARLVAGAREQLGGIDVVVNVAGGLSVIKALADTSKGEWEREVTRNAETVFLVSRAALPQLRETRGSIINFASPAGMRAVAQLGAYSAAKAGVIALTRALAIEEKATGVRVNAIAPGMIDTEQNRRADEQESGRTGERESGRRPERSEGSLRSTGAIKYVTREQVANTVVFLASDAASGITGETIHVLGEGIA